MTYEAWRISYQSDAQAARAAYAECVRLQAKVEEMDGRLPYGAIAKILTEVMDIATANGADSRSMPDEYVEVAAWLCGVPGAQPAPSIPEGWLRAIDEALVVAHIGVANESDTYEQAKAKLDILVGFHVDVATDPAVNGGWRLVPIEPMPSMPKLHVGYLPTINQDGYPALGAWWVQLWDGDDVFARVYGSSPEEAHNRAEMLAAAPEAKP